MKIFGRLAISAAVAAVLTVAAVCTSKSDKQSASDKPSALTDMELVGQWVDMNNGDKIELFKDGAGIVGDNQITWSTIYGKRFAMSRGDITTIADYNLSGYELTRTFDNGKVIVWVRKDSVDEYKKKKAEEAKEEKKQMIEKNTSYFTDSRDGQKYRAIKIGNQTWMAQNLNYQTDSGSWCYENKVNNCKKYGRLYNWNAASVACPAGWHLPLLDEQRELVETAGGRDTAGKALKSISGWENDDGTDNLGFSALPGGCRYCPRDEDFDDVFSMEGIRGVWWSNLYTNNISTDNFAFTELSIYANFPNSNTAYEGGYSGGDKENIGLSVRCVKTE